MNTRIIRSALLLLSAMLLLAACDHSVDDKLAAQAAQEQSLGISPSLFATKFNRTISDVLEDRKDEDAARMAPLYTIDVTTLHSGGEKHTFQTQVGPAQTSMLGSLAKDGDLKTIGVLLTNRSEGARAEFLLCAEATSRLVTDGDKKKLPDLIKRLVNNSLNNPGQRMTEVIGDKLLSVEIIQQGLMFQIEHK